MKYFLEPDKSRIDRCNHILLWYRLWIWRIDTIATYGSQGNGFSINLNLKDPQLALNNVQPSPSQLYSELDCGATTAQVNKQELFKVNNFHFGII